MFDKVMYKILGTIDDFFDGIWNWLTAPKCKCKMKGKNGRRTSNNK